ncbi:hypothetical protein Arub01_25700 [Actinomadura rubrobrunea]|uniref:DUF397 domain-containing protein n=1 Tax=Actinomadura rubrobrunea TaxID=115335 RepID=A0A9W6PWL3_9ACTN|nr:DUF397 domain-containing protein [Actinomadura rubrobrunea]GLW64326.1 hypothetical protein Arub01_25700 [Actinomadura rubrobrunea]
MVERTSSMGALVWRKSSASNPADDCVEVAAHEGRVLVRDSHDRSGAILVLEPRRWRALLRHIKDGGGDLR